MACLPFVDPSITYLTARPPPVGLTHLLARQYTAPIAAHSFSSVSVACLLILRDSNPCSVALSELDVVQEIRRQDGSKACGLDGIHMRIIKVLLTSSYPAVICRFFNLCVSARYSPLAWNSTDIHMVTKDASKPRNADNVRPITLVCMHGKLLERLLLVRFFDRCGWAKLHPTQAGFRGDCATLTNVAVVHHLLSTATVSYAAFIDVEKAFNIVGHARFSALLTSRRCLDYVHRLIRSLTFRKLRSHVLVNNQSSE